MWIPLTLLSAVGAAGTGLALKQTLGGGGLVASTVAYRAAGGVVLLVLLVGAGLGAPLGREYALTTALVIPLEVVGTLAFSLALRAGDLSLVQPLFGLLPVTVTLGGAVLLGERPTPEALAGVGLVASGVYALGLGGERGVLAPFRSLARDPAGRWAGVSILAWSLTTVLHKVGIAASGPMPWAVTLALGSAAAMLLVAPLLPRSLREGPLREAPEADPAAPEAAIPARWWLWIAAAGVLYAVQQIGLQFALGEAPASYVVALASTSILLAVAAGMLFLGERGAGRSRLLGGGLVTLGAAIVALYG